LQLNYYLRVIDSLHDLGKETLNKDNINSALVLQKQDSIIELLTAEAQKEVPT